MSACVETGSRSQTAARVEAAGASTLRASVALAGATLALLLAIGLFGAERAAAIPIGGFNVVPSSTQAGDHPDLGTTIKVTNHVERQAPPENFISQCACEDPREIRIHMPAGVIGAPAATPRCTAAEFVTNNCPVDAQVGVADNGISFFPGATVGSASPLFNVTPRPGEPGLLAFQVAVFQTPVFLEFAPRTGDDYGLDVRVRGIGHVLPISSSKLILWGVPADPSHDRLRWPFRQPPDVAWFPTGPPPPDRPAGSAFCDADGVPATDDPATAVKVCSDSNYNWDTNVPRPSASPPVPFLQVPTRCEGGQTSSVEVLGYDGSHHSATRPFAEMTGCDEIGFNPSLSASPTTQEADAPSGLDVNLDVPQLQSPEVPAPSQIRETTVTLPEGFSFNANAVNGKTSCSDDDANFGTEVAAECPEAAKIGTLEIESAVLPGILPGAIYLGEPKPGDRYRTILVADGFGVHIKLPGSIKPDPVNGRVVITFVDLPQTPLTSFRLHIFGSERGVLATPTQCGTYAVRSTFVPWNSVLPDQESTQFFTIESGPGGTPCPGPSRPFGPRAEVGASTNTAGAHADFHLLINRDDGNQELSDISVQMPPGFTASLRGVSYCPEATISGLSTQLYTGIAELGAPACPSSSQIGTTSATAGAGSRPVSLPGRAFLAGPYKGGPLSIVIVTPAVTGPYDLGNVAVRSALRIDPTSARITAASDPLPRIIEGVPLRLRQVLISLNRPSFALNPTDCRRQSATTTLTGDGGGSATIGSHFQVANCWRLGYRPSLKLRIGGATKRRGHPALHASLKTRPGDANISMVAVTLPRNSQLDLAHVKAPCTRTQFASGTCPATSNLGRAVATSPLLDEPLVGPVHLVTSSNKLPDLVVSLHGQVDIQLRGRVDSRNSSLRTTFENLPDLPVSTFRLDLKGGRSGLIVNSEDYCAEPGRATVEMRGQNNRRVRSTPRLGSPCGKRKASRSHARNSKSRSRARKGA
jgi:hypothetical protein